MKWEVSVQYRGEKAYYKIVPDENGMYHAHLLRYDGSQDFDPPPSKLIIFKGVRRWVGSAEQIDLLNELGKEIDYLRTSEDFVTPDSYAYTRKDTQQGNGSPDAFLNRQS